MFCRPARLGGSIEGGKKCANQQNKFTDPPETLVFVYPSDIPSSDSIVPLRRQIPLPALTLLTFFCFLFSALGGLCLGKIMFMPSGVSPAPWIIALLGCILISGLCFWVVAFGRLEIAGCGERPRIALQV